jgi:hypothetical protein
MIIKIISKIINFCTSLKERKLTFGVFPGCPQFFSSNLPTSTRKMSKSFDIRRRKKCQTMLIYRP